jgi:DUF1680 family protein
MNDRIEDLSLSRRRLLVAAGAAFVASVVGQGAGNATVDAAAPDVSSGAGAMPPLPKQAVTPALQPGAIPFDPAQVRLLNGPFLDAQTRDGAYLLSLDPDRLLHSFLTNAGLPPKAQSYGGWELLGVAGHIGGHYLSACSMMYRVTGEPEFRRRVDYMVSVLAQCQNQSSTGVVTAIPDYQDIFAKIAATGDVTGWAPWYTVHKLLAGLRDAYLYCGNEQAKLVFLKLSDWALAVTSALSDAQLAQMLDTEHGGMAETAADAYAMTGSRQYLELARRFTHHEIMDPLAAGQDILDFKHSNTNIPKLVGYERVYELTDDAPYHASAAFFWQTVVENRSYANGGNGDYEHFFPITDFEKHLSSDDQTETCCTYNMLKLTSLLFQKTPSVVYADYAERATLNHILATQEPLKGLVCYFTPMKPGQFRVYNDPENAMWCCTGTGIENHGRYGLSIYYQTPDAKTLYVNQYIASMLDWQDAGYKLRMDTSLPDTDTVKLTLSEAGQQRMCIKLRKPYWAEKALISVNGKRIISEAGPDGYFAIERSWKIGDTIHMQMAMALRLEPVPRGAHKFAAMYGPVLLASPMGVSGMDATPDVSTDQHPYENLPAIDVPTFVGDRTRFSEYVKPVKGSPLTFRTSGLGDPSDVTLAPLFRTQHQRYNLYWSVYSPEEWQQVKVQRAADLKSQQELDARTVDVFYPANQQSEVDHNLQSANSRTGVGFDRAWRDADGGFFSFTMKVDPTVPMQLLCTYWGGDTGNRVFDITIDGSVLATQTLNAISPGAFADVTYDIPPSFVAGKKMVVVSFKAKPGNIAGGLFGCRVLKKVVDRN